MEIINESTYEKNKMEDLNMRKWVVFDIEELVFYGDEICELRERQEDYDKGNSLVDFYEIEAETVNEARIKCFEIIYNSMTKEDMKEYKSSILCYIGSICYEDGKSLEELKTKFGENEGEQIFNIAEASEEYLLSETNFIDSYKMSSQSKELYDLLDLRTIKNLYREDRIIDFIAYPLITKK